MPNTSPACLEVMGAVWFPEPNLGNAGARGNTPTPRFWLCLLAAALLFSTVAAFEIKMCFKKPNPQTSLCGVIVSSFMQTQVCVEHV